MVTPVSRKVDSKFRASLATVALAIACGYGSAASSQIGTVGSGIAVPAPAQAMTKTSISAPSKNGGQTASLATTLAAISTALQPTTPLVIFVDHKSYESMTSQTTVGAALAEARVALGNNDIVLPGRNEKLPADGIIHVQRVRSWTQRICAQIAPRTITIDSTKLLKNTTKIQDTGHAGLRQTVIRFTSIDGARASGRVIAVRVLTHAKPRIIARGTATLEIHSIALRRPDRLDELAETTMARTDLIAHAAMAMIATAYTAFCDSCSGTGRGATGLTVRHGIVAVDPRIIPLGSRLFIPGYGRAIAGDTGGAIVGHRIDLAFNSYNDAMQFGRRPVKVYVLP